MCMCRGHTYVRGAYICAGGIHICAGGINMCGGHTYVSVWGGMNTCMCARGGGGGIPCTV